MLLIIFSNLTQTSSFKKIASKNGIGGLRVIQTPLALTDSGCSYALRARYEDRGAVFRLMEESKILPVHIYHANVLTKGKLTYTKIK